MPSLFQFASIDKDSQSPCSRSSSGMPTNTPPPQLPSHGLSKKPPRLSMCFYKTSSTTCPDSPSAATRMRKRFSSFLLSSPIIRHSNSQSSLSVRHRQTVKEEYGDDDRDDITTPPTSASDDLFLSSTTLQVDDKKQTPSAVLSLAELVRRELGTAVEAVDEEIDREWEVTRRVLRQSLLLRASQRPTVY